MKPASLALLAESIRSAFGFDGRPALGAFALPMSAAPDAAAPDRKAIGFLESVFASLAEGNISEARGSCGRWSEAMAALFEQAVEACDRAWGDFDDARLRATIASLRSGDRQAAATALARLWAPEIAADRDSTTASWKLRSVRANDEPIRPDQVLLQLNGLYTLPDRVPGDLPPDLADLGRAVLADPGRKLADYDHPVPLFEDDASHELVACLAMLERDLAFEKLAGVLPAEHRVPVLLSVSVTHERLGPPVSAWIRRLLDRTEYRHFRIFLLTEEACRRLDSELFGGTMPQFGVSGAYGRHFSALKYAGLLFERSHGIRASFKLDTDEAMCSADLKAATGKTWMETLCHPYWGGSAVDSDGRAVRLDVNEGEYVNGSDIESLGYAGALRTPDVRPPAGAAGRDVFFQKGYAHGNATAWYNGFGRLDDFISHPVVKGGGYGITNDGLRRATPFAWSRVGRAEDQQFYFSALAGGVRAIFHPDLRIAHYKGAVSASEGRTEASRLAGDMYRIVQFAFLARRFGVKDRLDPMPGVFAGDLARAQAFFHLMHRAAAFFLEGKHQNGRFLLAEGVQTLHGLESLIDSGEAEKELSREAALWKRFAEEADSRSAQAMRRVLEACLG